MSIIIEGCVEDEAKWLGRDSIDFIGIQFPN